MKPEEKTRQRIDQLLTEAGWKIQDKTELNLSAAFGVAVRDFSLKSGFADYLLFVDKKVSIRWYVFCIILLAIQVRKGREDAIFKEIIMTGHDIPEAQAYCWSCGRKDSEGNIICIACGGRLSPHTSLLTIVDEIPKQEDITPSSELDSVLLGKPSVSEDTILDEKLKVPIAKTGITRVSARFWIWGTVIVIAVFLCTCSLLVHMINIKLGR